MATKITDSDKALEQYKKQQALKTATLDAAAALPNLAAALIATPLALLTNSPMTDMWDSRSFNYNGITNQEAFDEAKKEPNNYQAHKMRS